jgi:hypothetical protein
VEQCDDTDKPGYQRVCFEITSYCDGFATPFAFDFHIQSLGMDLSRRSWRDPTTGQETEVNLSFPDETRLIPEEETARLTIAIDYFMQIPPSLILFEATSAATATRGCDAFLSISTPRGTDLLPAGGNDMDYFLAQRDFIPMVLIAHVQVPYLLPEVR